MDQRIDFVQACLAHNRPSIESLAELFGISEKTGHKWLDRFREGGLPALQDRSRRPHNSPGATDPAVRRAIISLRHEYPRWGPKKLVELMRVRYPDLERPSASTAGGIIKAEGLVRPRRGRVQRAGPRTAPFAPVTAPNDTWAIDHKGQFNVDRRPCYPLTLTDAFSRFLLVCEACPSTAYEHAKPKLERAFREHGLPLRMRSDNGPPFGARGIGGLSKLSVYLARLGIEQEFITPGEPQENGGHERMHRTLNAEAVLPPESDWRAQQTRFDKFVRDYNDVRPHEALQMRTPASVYADSPRIFPKRLPAFAYHTGCDVRRVRHSGEIRWRGGLVFIGEALIGENVALLESNQDGWWTLHLGKWELGLLGADGTLIKRPRARWVPGFGDPSTSQPEANDSTSAA